MRQSKARARFLAVIPARGGSKGIPRKNVRPLCGKPLIGYSIEAGRSSTLIDTVVVSTEDEQIAEISTQYGAEVIKRPPQLARDHTPSLPVLQHVIRYLADADNLRPEVIVLLQPTSPLRTAADVDTAIRMFLDRGCDSVVSVCEVEHPLEWMYTISSDRLEPVVTGGDRVARRQDALRVYRLNGAVYVTSRDAIMNESRLLGSDTRAYIMPLERSIDIDTEIDLKLAELLMRERG